VKIETRFTRFDANKRLFTLMVIVVITIIVDSQIGYVADFIPKQLSSNGGIITFIVIAVIFTVTQFLILNYIK
jgi:hypothetical protein